MIEPHILEELNLDREWVEQDLRLCQDLAQGYQTLAQHSEGAKAREAYRISASFYRRAAAHALLLGLYTQTEQWPLPPLLGAYQLFSKATNAYDKAGLPYSAFVCIFLPHLGGNPQFVHNWLEAASSFEEEAFPQILYLLIYASVLFRDWQELFPSLQVGRRRLELYQLEPIGILRTPLANYLDLIDTFQFRPNANDIEAAIYTFLSQYDFAIRQAQKNEYHWQRLAMPFHPVEPDIFAVMLSADRVLRNADPNRSILDLIERFPMGGQAKSLLKGVLSDYGRDYDGGIFDKQPVLNPIY
jgi:hypothetical protein